MKPQSTNSLFENEIHNYKEKKGKGIKMKTEIEDERTKKKKKKLIKRRMNLVREKKKIMTRFFRNEKKNKEETYWDGAIHEFKCLPKTEQDKLLQEIWRKDKNAFLDGQLVFKRAKFSTMKYICQKFLLKNWIIRKKLRHKKKWEKFMNV